MGDHRGTAQDGLGGATEGAEGILRGRDTMLKLQRAVPGTPEAPGSPGIPAPRGLCAAEQGAGGSVLAVAGLLCCAGTPRGHTKVPGAPGDSAGASKPRGLPWLFWVHLLGTTMGTVVSGHFKLDFKSQVGLRSRSSSPL